MSISKRVHFVVLLAAMAATGIGVQGQGGTQPILVVTQDASPNPSDYLLPRFCGPRASTASTPSTSMRSTADPGLTSMTFGWWSWRRSRSPATQADDAHELRERRRAAGGDAPRCAAGRAARASRGRRRRRWPTATCSSTNPGRAPGCRTSPCPSRARRSLRPRRRPRPWPSSTPSTSLQASRPAVVRFGVPPPGPSISRAARPTCVRAIRRSPGSTATARTAIAPTTSSSRTSTSTGLAMPHADVQMRLFSRVIADLLRRPADGLPLPRLWYFPDASRTVMVLTGDSHTSDPGAICRAHRRRGIGRRPHFAVPVPLPRPRPPARWRPGWPTATKCRVHPFFEPDGLARRLPGRLRRRVQLVHWSDRRPVAPGPTVRHHSLEWGGWVDPVSVMEGHDLRMDLLVLRRGVRPSTTRRWPRRPTATSPAAACR